MAKKLVKKQAGGDTSRVAKAVINQYKAAGWTNDNKASAKSGIDTTKMATLKNPKQPKNGGSHVYIPLKDVNSKKKGGAVKSKKK